MDSCNREKHCGAVEKRDSGEAKTRSRVHGGIRIQIFYCSAFDGEGKGHGVARCCNNDVEVCAGAKTSWEPGTGYEDVIPSTRGTSQSVRP
jgi:hypothetical protein